MKKLYFLILLLGLTLSGCAAPIPASEMVANKMIYPLLDKNKLSGNVGIGKVSVADSAPKTGLIVTPEEFSSALKLSMNTAGWISQSSSPKYALEANFIGFEQPFTLFNTKIFSEANYTLRKASSGDIVYKQTIKIPCVLGMADVFDGNLRQIETMKCSIRENVTHLLRDLNSKF